MKHLSDVQLSAHLDRALAGRAAEEAARHLAACELCRESLAELAAQEETLRPALTNDPGEAYFERFSSRVEERIQAAAPAGAPAPGQGFDLGRFFRSPRGLAWVGGAAVLVAGAGVVLITAREVRPPDLRDRDIVERSQRAAPPAAMRDEAPARGTLEGQDEAEPADALAPSARATRGPAPTEAPTTPAQRRLGAPPAAGQREGIVALGSQEDRPTAGAPVADEERAAVLEKEQRRAAPASEVARREDRLPAAPRATPLAQATPDDARQASPKRAIQVRRNEAGEDVPVRRQGEAGFAAPPPPTPAANSEGDQAARVRKKTLAEPLKGSSTWGAPKSLYSGAAKGESTASGPASASPSAGAASNRTMQALARDRAAEGEGRLCGEVRDAAGRPVAGAQVAVADLGRTAITDARGAFCISAPKGEHSLSVMAVGYTESRESVRVGGEQPRVRITLAAVPVLEDKLGSIAGRKPLPRVPATPPAEPRDSYSGLSDTIRPVVREAQRLTAEATARKSAAGFDAAAGAWERSLRLLAGGPLEMETRRNLAEARYRAWETGPNARRAAAAVEALTAYTLRAPAGPDRDRAARWLDRVKP